MAENETPEQAMARRIDSLRYKVESLQSDVRLASLRDGLEDNDTKVNGLTPCVQDLRNQGYVFGKDLESKASGYQRQWQAMRQNVVKEIDRQSPLLEAELRPLERQFSSVRAASNPLSMQSSVSQLESSLDNLQSRVNAVRNNISGMYDSLQSEVNTFKERLDRLSEMLNHFSGACFRLLPTEGAVMAVKATYSKDEKMDKDDPQGFLFLTDQRLLFEQNQDVPTKKVLFIVTETQKVQKLLLEIPVGQIEQVQASKKGLFGHEDHLLVTYMTSNQKYQAWLHLDGQDCNEWQTLVGQARSAEFASERAVAIDPKDEQKVKQAPSQCPNCGAPITQAVLRGMDHIQCEYCQFVIRL
jgi:phage shock protein A